MAIPDSHEEMKESNNGKKLFTPAEFDTLILDLKRFIHQSHSPDLKIGGYLKSFGGIPVALSFGKGTPAQVTWLSFKKKITNPAARGPYFVSLYYDKVGYLFLVLGIKDEWDGQAYDWSVPIQQRYPRFEDADVSEPISKRYPKSRIFSQYPVDVDRIDDSIDSIRDRLSQDLADAFNVYLDFLDDLPVEPDTKYWRIAPGKNGVHWPTWKAENICSIGYDEFLPYYEELRQIPDRQTFEKRLVQIAKRHDGPEDFSFMLTSKPYSHQDALWYFLREMKPGDRVVASTGKTYLRGIGTVTSDLVVRPDREHPFVRSVQWESLDPGIPVPSEVKVNFHVTLNRLKPEDFSLVQDAIAGIIQPDPDPVVTDPLRALLRRKGQVILYGPPGTGKTFRVQDLMKDSTSQAYTVEETDYSETRIYLFTAIVGRDFETHKIVPRKEYVYTWGPARHFQKPFSYLKEGDILVCYEAKWHSFIGIATCTGKTDSSFSYRFVKEIPGPSFQEMKADPILSQASFVRMSLGLSLADMERGDFERVLHLNGLTPQDLGFPSSKTKKPVDHTEFVTFHQSFSYEEFIEGLRPTVDEDGKISYSVLEGVFKQFCRSAYNYLLSEAGIDLRWEDGGDVPTPSDDEKKRAIERVDKVPFYFVIDEINRGDISRIFGELITLLEHDKRLLAPHEITTRLPSSRTRFGIPPNLYVIGTMNTADKSIALIDVALRRRFGFIEMMPDYDLLEEHLVADEDAIQEIYTVAIELLRSINQRILEEYDRDHQVGHSFLMKLAETDTRDEAIAELALVWYHEVLPLLQEYFYDSPKRLLKVIGSEFMEKDAHGVAFTPVKEGEPFLQSCKNLVKGSQ